MADVKIIVELILKNGPFAILLIAIALIISDPDRAEKLKALIIRPFFRLFKWGSLQYVASEVNYAATAFIGKDIKALLPSTPDVKIKIKWVTSPSDPILSKDGTLILRMQETDDQSRNILAATRSALPYVIYTALRPNLERYVESAIDLVLLRRLSERLGRHARPVFQRHFLSPRIDEDPRTLKLFEKLLQIDNSGTFVTIFLEELGHLGDTIYAFGQHDDKTDQIQSFLEYLISFANREIGETISLDYWSSDLRVSIVILAKSAKAKAEGIKPYLDMIDGLTKKGADSIYVVAYHGFYKFLRSVIQGIEGNPSLTVLKINKVRARGRYEQEMEIALLCRTGVAPDYTLKQAVENSGLKEGGVVEGTVMDVAQNIAVVNVHGCNGIIYRDECSWGRVAHCSETYEKGALCEFVIKRIDTDKGKLELSNRFPDEDPWKSKHLPNVRDIIDIEIKDIYGASYIGLYKGIIEVSLPKHEVSWPGEHVPEMKQLLNTQQRVVIYEKSAENRTLKCSIRRLDEDPWPLIHKQLPKGTRLRGKVSEVMADYVRVELPDGLTGTIPSSAMIQRAALNMPIT